MVERLDEYGAEPEQVTITDDPADAPSAGCGNAWEDDLWLGIADYLSYRAWIEQGLPDFGYDISDDTIDACIASCGRDRVKDAADLLAENDALRIRIVARIGR